MTLMASRISRLASISVRYKALNGRNIATATSPFSGAVETVPLSYMVYDEFCKQGGEMLPPIVIAHGMLGSKSNWHSLAKALNRQTHRKVFAVDSRGHGQSPHHPRLDYESQSADLIEFIRSQHVAKAVLIGHSMGGKTVIMTSTVKPEIVDRLISVDVSPFRRYANEVWDVVQFLTKIQWDDGLTVSKVRQLADKELSTFIDNVPFRQFLLTNLIEENHKVKWRCDLQEICRSIDVIRRPLENLRSFQGSTFFIGGGESGYLGEEDHEQLREFFPRAEFAYIPGAGHFVHSEKPQEFLEIVTKILEST